MDIFKRDFKGKFTKQVQSPHLGGLGRDAGGYVKYAMLLANSGRSHVPDRLPVIILYHICVLQLA
jgi:hypothetical protein